jgi:hypothetical protein
MQRSKGNGQSRRGSPARREESVGAALALAMLGFAGAALAQVAEPEPDPSRPASEELVACLLPAEINRLGQLTILGARQKIETSRRDCLDRGGEVIDPGAPAAEPTDQAR